MEETYVNQQEQLRADLETALRERDAVRKSAICMALAALKNARVGKNADLTEDEMLAALAKEVKLRRSAVAEFERARHQDLVASESAELAVLEAYLPEALSADEIAGWPARRSPRRALTLPGGWGK